MQKTILIFIFLWKVCTAGFSDPNDIAVVTVTAADNWMYGEAFINGLEIVRIAQQYNLDPQLLTEQHLQEKVWGYFDYHFAIEDKNGSVKKVLQDMRNKNPDEFLSSGLFMEFSVNLENNTYPFTLTSNLFFEVSKTSTTKLIFKDSQGKNLQNSIQVFLTTNSPEFQFDLKNPDFSTYDFSPLDSDKDGLLDNFELLYDFDPHNPDTDEDSFSDFEELLMGWDPFNPELADNQTRETLNNEINAFAETYRRKPTWKYAMVSIHEHIVSTFAEDDSQTVLQTLKLHSLEKERSSEEIYFKEFLGSLERNFYKRFDWGDFFILMAFAVMMGFLHTGLSGPGKGILIAYLAKEDREFRTGFSFSLSFSAVHITVTAVMSVIFILFTALTTFDIQQIAYIIQLSAGALLGACSVFFITRSWKKLREHIVVSKQTFLDKPAGAIIIGGVTALGTSPYLWSLFDFLIEIEQPILIPFVFLMFGAGIAVCLVIVTLAVIGIRHIIFDIFPKFIHYAELASAVLFLFFTLFFLFRYIPF
ncbi:MAG: hypothetical protein JW904_00060 [Spirochaetales bacterium]|nr:hypothetical protein [Spirochaetales bacterium]